MKKKNSGKEREKPGRELEELATRIESFLASGEFGKRVEFKSPDKIPDLITGTLREVDASLRQKVGSAELLIVLECRDRQEREDVTWIEELSARRRSIGADKIIAISSKGFSKEAVKKARQESIELRYLRDVTKEVVQNWTGDFKGVAAKVKWWIEDFSLFGKAGKSIELADNLAEEKKQKGDQAVIIFPYDNTEPHSVRWHTDVILTKHFSSPKTEFKETDKPAQIWAEARPKSLYTYGKNGEEEIAKVRLEVRIQKFYEPLQLTVEEAHDYGSTTGKILEQRTVKSPFKVSQFGVEVEGEIEFTFYQLPSSDSKDGNYKESK